MATQAQLAAVQQLYVGYLGRAADSAGQQFWANAIANGTATIASVATGFTLSAEYKAAYGGLSTDALVEKVYNNVLGRTPDAEGKAFWVAALANGKVTADTLVATIVTNLGALDQQTINNKVFVAQTYTDTVGANYNVAAGTASIVGVDSTTASVTTAIGNISNGTLPGLVPGLAQINAVAAAKDAVTAFEKATAVANPTFDTLKADGVSAGQDGSVTLAELTAASNLAKAAHDTAVGALVTTATAQATLTNLTAATATAKAAAVTASSDAAVANLDAALAAQATAKGTAADQAAVAAAKASAIAGFGSAFGSQSTVTLATLDSKTLATGDIASAADVYTQLTSLTLSSGERAALVAEVNKVGTTGVALVAAADKEVAVAKADAAVATATAAAGGGTATAYVNAAAAQKTQADKVAVAVKADADVAAIKVAIDAHTALDNAVIKAGVALTAVNSAKVAITDISTKVAVDAVDGSAAKQDVFYFAAKATSTNDVTIGSAGASFGAGDSIVVGSGYTFNAGALSSGNNSVAEMFLVQGAKGVQIVLENSVFGSATATTGADGVVAASTGDGVSVITLTGVNIEHVSVANGIVSYV